MESAFRPEEWSQHTEALRRMARELLREEHQSEDLVQSAYLTALERPPRALTRAWLAKVLRRRGLDSLRRQDRRRASEAREGPDHAPDTGELAVLLERHEAVVSALRSLRNPYAQALYMRYFDGLAPAEIAERLDVPLKTVKTRLHRGLQQMRVRLERRYGPEAGGLHAALAPFVLGQWTGATTLAPIAMAPASAAVTGGVGIMAKKIAIVAVVLVLGAWGVRYVRTHARQPVLPVVAGATEESSDAGALEAQPRETLAAPKAEEGRELATDEQVAEQPVVNSPNQGAVIVQVVWANEEAAAGVGIGVHLSNPGLPYTAVRQRVSDSNGSVRFESLPRGEIELHSDRGGSASVKVVAGEETRVRFVLPAGVDVEGLVVDGRGVPIAHAQVWLATMYRDWSGGRQVAATDTEGFFRVRDVPPGISLGAKADGFTPSALVDLDLMDTTEPPVQIRLQLTNPGAALIGRVTTPDGEPLEGARVCVGSAKSFRQMRLGKGFAEEWAPQSQLCDADGRYRFTTLDPGERPVAVAAVGYPVWQSKVELTVDGETELDIRLESGVTIEGTVKDGQGEPVARAALRAFDRAIEETFLQQGQYDYDGLLGYPAVIADGEGRYRLEAVAPGEVHLYASPAGRPTGKVRPYASHIVQAQPGETLTWNPVLSRGRTITGLVTYKNGAPMVNVFVTARNDKTGKSQALMSDRSSGRFEFLNLGDASYSFGVQLRAPPEDAEPLEKKSVWPDSGELLLVASFDEPVDVTPGTVSGRVDDAAGRLAHHEALTVILESDKRWWRSYCKIEGSEFTFPDVPPGRFVPLVLSGEEVVHVGEWFELGPGEDRDVGTLVTRPGGAVTLRLLRGKGTETVEPTAYLIPQNTIHARKVEFGSESERSVENLNPGKYNLRLQARGMSRVFHEFEVEVGQVETHELQLRPAVRRALEIDYPAGVELGKLYFKIADESGDYDWDMTLTNTGALDRPYSFGPWLPLGRFTLSAETGSGLSGSIEFEVLTLEPDQDPVRLTLE